MTDNNGYVTFKGLTTTMILTKEKRIPLEEHEFAGWGS